MDFELCSEDLGPWSVVMVRGEVDLATAPRLGEALRAVARRAAGVVVDLGGVTFMDSSGVSALVRSREEMARRGGELVLTRATPTVRRILELTGLADRFRWAASPEEVLGDIPESPRGAA